MENYVSIANNLPSKCLVYPEIDISKQDSIQIRSFKGKDEKLIAELSTQNFEKKFVTIFRNVLKGIDPLKLTLGDRMYLMFWEVIQSYSKDFPVDYECEHCWQKFTQNVDLSKLDNIELPKDYKEPYPVKLPSGEMLNLRLLRVEDVLKADDLIKAGQNVWLYRYALSIMNGKDVWENVEYLENISTKDLMVIRGFHDKFAHGPKAEVIYNCPNCGGTGTLPVPFRLEMFLPFGETLKNYIGNAI